jgi:glutamate dehydrogenase
MHEAFPEGYKEQVVAGDAVDDARSLMALAPGDMAVRLCDAPSDDPTARRLKVYRSGEAMSLSEMLPVLHELGVGVVDERPYEVESHGHTDRWWIYDFGLTLTPGVDSHSLALRFEEAFTAAWNSRVSRDGVLALVSSAGLTWRQVALVQAITAYVRQLGSAFGQRYVEQVLVRHGAVVRNIVDLFESRLDPDRPREAAGGEELLREIRMQLDDISSLEEDRIVRSLLTVVLAITRTNHYRAIDGGQAQSIVTFKLEPRRIPEAPEPRPEFEMWVYSPRFSGESGSIR